jgi:hypothetical protein
VYPVSRHFGTLDTDQFGKLDPDLDPIRSEKQDPDPHQSETVEALKGHFEALEDPNLGEK